MKEFQYLHENGKNYLVIESEKQNDNSDFQMKMLSKNSLRGILRMESRAVNGNKKYYYDISGKQQLCKNYDYGFVSWDDVKQLCESISQTVKLLRNYMLDVDLLLLKPECIFTDISKTQFFYTYCPENEEDFSTMLKTLFEYLLEHFNHDTDRSTLLSMYEVYQKIIQNEYDIENLSALTEQKTMEKFKNITKPEETQLAKSTVVEPDIHRQEIIEEIEASESKTKNAYKILRSVSVILAALSAIAFLFNGIFKINRYVCGAIFVVSLIILYDSIKKLGTKKENKVVNNNVVPVSFFDDDEIVESKSLNEEIMGQTENLEKAISTLSRKIFLVDENGEECEVYDFPYIIGRINDMCSLAVKNNTVSRMHARIILKEDGFYIEDLNSKNGTKVNGLGVSGNSSAKLNNTDEISISSVLFTVKII